MTTRELLTKELNRLLALLGWDENHPRIQSFLAKTSQKLKYAIFSTDNLTDKYFNYLVECIKLFRTCQHLLSLLKKSWNDEDVLAIFAKHSNSAQMPLAGWTELYSHLDTLWFETSGGF